MSYQPITVPSPKNKRRLYETVFESIAIDILNDALRPGTSLAADSILSTKFGVSRTVIRETIQVLSTVGMVDVRHGAGTYVNSSHEWDLLNPQLLSLIGRTGSMDVLIDDLLDIRRMFEVEAAALAARRATKDDIDALQILIDKMKSPETTEEQHVDLNL